MSAVYVVDGADNVATALSELQSGSAAVIGCRAGQRYLEIGAPVQRGHKVALCGIRRGESIVKYGAVIGRATEDIAAGAWVHIHNMESLYDSRSATAIDPFTGKVTDTKYE